MENNMGHDQVPLDTSIEQPLRVAILQRVLPEYRLGLFKALGEQRGLCLRVFIGADLPASKVRSAPDLSGLDVVKLHTRFFSIAGNRLLANHLGLVSALAEFEPDAILCEGESNILSYLKAVWYRVFHPRTALLHWSLGGVPGAVAAGTLRRSVKRLLLSMFDVFVSYSSHGRAELIRLGCKGDRVHVAVNVSNTSRHLDAARRLILTKEQARRELGLTEQFTVLFAGALEDDKRVEYLLSALAQPVPLACNLVVLGDGPLKESLIKGADSMALCHAQFPGRVSWEVLAKYYRASDVFVLPGRGGMVMSEAMAHGLPVVVHQADGTEADLVRDGETGLRLDSGSPEAIRAAIIRLCDLPEATSRMGAAGQALIESNYSISNSATAIRSAIMMAVGMRRDKGSRACASS